MSFKSVVTAICILGLGATVTAHAAPNQAPAAGFAIVEASGEMVSLPTPRPTVLPSPTAKRTPPASLGVFQSVAISAARLPAAAKWQSVKDRNYAALFGDRCHESGLSGCDTRFARRLGRVADEVAGLSERDLLDVVNRRVNTAMRYQEDTRTWDAGDYWATPSEMALKGAGDCEDFATAKYWLLRSLGISDRQMQLVVLQDTGRGLFHAVLVVHTAAGAYVLDNVNNRLQRDTAYANYHPLMSFAAGKNYIHGFLRGTRALANIPSDLSAVAPGLGI